MVPTASPKAGYIGEDTANSLSDVLFFLVFVNVFLVFWGFLIIPRWLIKVPDIFQYFLAHFWNFPKIEQILTFPLLFLCRNSSNDTIKRLSS